MSAPSSAAISAGRDLMFGAIVETANLAASYARNAAGAAWRGDEATLRTDLADMKSAMVAALKAFNQLVSEGAQERAA